MNLRMEALLTVFGPQVNMMAGALVSRIPFQGAERFWRTAELAPGEQTASTQCSNLQNTDEPSRRESQNMQSCSLWTVSKYAFLRAERRSD